MLRMAFQLLAEREGLPSVIPKWGASIIEKPGHFVNLAFSASLLACVLRTQIRIKQKKPLLRMAFQLLAEREGFEPSDPVRDQQFSRLPHSTALASLLNIELLLSHGKDNPFFNDSHFKTQQKLNIQLSNF